MAVQKDWVKFWNNQQTGLHHSTDAAYYTWLGSELRLLLPEVSTRSVLDLGCGTGELYVDLGFDKAKRYRGVDLSSSMLERFRARQPDVDLVLNSAESYLVQERFDLIFSNAVVQYLNSAQLENLVSHIAQMLAPGGYAALTMVPWSSVRRAYHVGDMLPPSVGLFARTKRLVKTFIRDPMGHWYSWNDIRRFAQKNGLETFFHGSLADPYRFHVVLTRRADGMSSTDALMKRLLASRRS